MASGAMSDEIQQPVPIVTAHFSGMLEDIELHVGQAPQCVNNMMFLTFESEYFIQGLNARICPSQRR